MHEPIRVTDPFDARNDPTMPLLPQALDPLEAGYHLERFLPRLVGDGSEPQIRLIAILVVRHKPGRRCLIEYVFEVDERDGRPQHVSLMGKVRVKGLDESTYHLMESLWNTSFSINSEDGVSVPEPIGVIPVFRMWLQRKVSGTPATDLLAKPGGVLLSRRIAEAAFRLHEADIPSHRRHTMTDELRILHDRLTTLAEMEPQWELRLGRILAACDRLAEQTPAPKLRGIHRDFYPDHVIVDGARLHLLDLDLYCLGDPALDIGNFIGHVIEDSLRNRDDPDALLTIQQELEERFVELSGESTRTAVHVYAVLTLARHVFISTQFPERRPFTQALMTLCEHRLGI